MGSFHKFDLLDRKICIVKRELGHTSTLNNLLEEVVGNRHGTKFSNLVKFEKVIPLPGELYDISSQARKIV